MVYDVEKADASIVKRNKGNKLYNSVIKITMIMFGFDCLTVKIR